MRLVTERGKGLFLFCVLLQQQGGLLLLVFRIECQLISMEQFLLEHQSATTPSDREMLVDWYSSCCWEGENTSLVVGLNKIVSARHL